ncbi:hypothetical protein RchiOBHm_Chr6g0288801 [Rosa chinensis]|uniref:Uncharacterized protein n=1 Tax=Rosa chinensis TaxID=74649 RepID=A0A2P6PVF3_ROSCH|nr:hypothetical protein RchiOBHm_Chr6g0288801 [Rosa chinensis]
MKYLVPVRKNLVALVHYCMCHGCQRILAAENICAEEQNHSHHFEPWTHHFDNSIIILCCITIRWSRC